VVQPGQVEFTQALRTCVLITAGYTTGFCVSAIMISAFFPGGGPSLWPIGAVTLFIGAGTGICLVGGLLSLLRAVTRPAAGRSQREDKTAWLRYGAHGCTLAV